MLSSRIMQSSRKYFSSILKHTPSVDSTMINLLHFHFHLNYKFVFRYEYFHFDRILIETQSIFIIIELNVLDQDK